MFPIKMFGRDLCGGPFFEISERSFVNVGLTMNFALSTSMRVS